MLPSTLLPFGRLPALVAGVFAVASSLREGDDCPQGVSFSLDSAAAVDDHPDVALDRFADTEFGHR